MNASAKEANTPSILSEVTLVIQKIQQGRSSSDIIVELYGDGDRYATIATFLHAHKWLTDENEYTEKAKVWMEMAPELGLVP